MPAVAWALGVGGPGAAVLEAQAPPPEETEASPADAVEAYLERLGLKELLAEQLALRLKASQGPARLPVAERLSRLYVDLLGAARTNDERRVWEQKSRELLEGVPEADSFELRINLFKAMYVPAEETIERSRLRLAKPEEVAEAERVLRTIKPQLEEIAARVNGRVDLLEKQEEKGEDTEALTERLSEARRLRSLGFYYAAWAGYYLAYLTGTDPPAADALKDFGWLLNSRGGRPASVERLPAPLLKYEHVARAAIGCGLSESARGHDVTAMRWFDALEQAEGVPTAVKDQLLPRRIAVYAGARRWADLERLIRVTRHAGRDGGGKDVQPLPVGAARLLAIVSLEADKSNARGVIEGLSAVALGDLVARGEIAHVLDLMERYGTAPIGDKGFIVNYVRGLQKYDAARAAHKKDGADPEEPSTSAEAVDTYRQAATMLDAAMKQEDAPSFGGERARAALLVGLSLFYAGDLPQAAEKFQEASRIAPTPEKAADALWLAIVSLDRAVEGKSKGDAAVEKRRDEAASLFLQSYPGTERAAALLVRRATSGLLADEEAVRVLLGVNKESPLYERARQHAAKLLYSLYRASHGPERDFAAMRFVGVAEETLGADRKRALEQAGPEGLEAARRVVIRVRQVLDALLGVSNPDAPRAEAALAILSAVASHHGIDLAENRAELTFRRLQIALARDDAAGAADLVEQLSAAGADSQFSIAADQLMFRRAADQRQREQASGKDGPKKETLGAIVKHGVRVIDRAGEPSKALADPAILSAYEVVAQAACDLWEREQDTAMRDVSMRLDKAVLAARPQAEGSLRRLARTAEAAGDVATALQCWRTLMSGLAAGSEPWFEARYHTLRLLARTDQDRAREAMRQHVLLYPKYGPDPWGARIKELDATLGPAPTPPPGPPAGSGPDKPGGGP